MTKITKIFNKSKKNIIIQGHVTVEKIKLGFKDIGINLSNNECRELSNNYYLQSILIDGSLNLGVYNFRKFTKGTAPASKAYISWQI